MSTNHASERPDRRRRRRWRLKVLLGLTTVLLAFFVFSRLSPEQAKRLGPWGQTLYELVNPPISVSPGHRARIARTLNAIAPPPPQRASPAPQTFVGPRS
jgi:hypothetical protein